MRPFVAMMSVATLTWAMVGIDFFIRRDMASEPSFGRWLFITYPLAALWLIGMNPRFG